jgi:PAS domain S-box-containing protein
MDPLGSHGRRPLRKGQPNPRNILPLLQTQFAVSKVLATSEDLSSALPTIIASICINLGWELGAYWQYAPNRPVLVCTHISAADETLGNFIAGSRKNELLAGEGLPGRVFATSEPAWIANLSEDEYFRRNSVAANAGLRSAFAFPVLVGNEAVAILEFFSASFREPDEELLQTMVALGRQIGQFIKRREAEEALQQSLELYRNLTDSASDAIVTIDESSNIMLANQATEKMFGYSASEMKGQNVLMLIPERVRSRYEQLISNYLESEERKLNWQNIEITGLHQDGHEIVMDVSFGEFQLKDQRFFTGFMRDVTQRKKLEGVLKSTERLTVIGRLAASIAHEINNPLDAIKNVFYLLAHSASEEQMGHITVGQEELKKVVEIIRRTLGFARETTAATEIQVQPLLDETIELLSRKIQQKNINVEKQYRLNEPITANTGELRQVFVNLIANALDAMSLNGKLSIRTYFNRSFFGRGSAAIVIADDGQGIPPQTLSHLFEPFFTTKGEEGTGLGLWISREILEKYGATIKVRSRVGARKHGTCFRISFPLANSSFD